MTELTKYLRGSETLSSRVDDLLAEARGNGGTTHRTNLLLEALVVVLAKPAPELASIEVVVPTGSDEDATPEDRNEDDAPERPEGEAPEAPEAEADSPEAEAADRPAPTKKAKKRAGGKVEAGATLASSELASAAMSIGSLGFAEALGKRNLA